MPKLQPQTFSWWNNYDAFQEVCRLTLTITLVIIQVC